MPAPTCTDNKSKLASEQIRAALGPTPLFLTNDDGIASPGLAAAAQALLPLGPVLAVAPKGQQTSMGRARKGAPEACLCPYALEGSLQGVAACDPDRPARLHPAVALSLDASPAFCVLHAMANLPALRPRLLVSGVNYGENLGVNVTGSGTVGAALEAACLGIPALAVSLETSIEDHHNHSQQDWTGAIHFVRLFASKILRQGMPAGAQILKVDIPARATALTPWRITSLSPYAFFERKPAHPDLANPLSSFCIAKRDCSNDPPDTDSHAVLVAGLVSVTPMTVDLTARSALAPLGDWLRA